MITNLLWEVDLTALELEMVAAMMNTWGWEKTFNFSGEGCSNDEYLKWEGDLTALKLEMVAAMMNTWSGILLIILKLEKVAATMKKEDRKKVRKKNKYTRKAYKQTTSKQTTLFYCVTDLFLKIGKCYYFWFYFLTRAYKMCVQ